MVGPLVLLRLAPMALARMWARVVLPRPGGPLNRMWSMASLRCLAAATVISRRSLTLAWPVNSENSDGRSVISNAASGFASTSEIFCSAIAPRMGKERAAQGGKSAWRMIGVQEFLRLKCGRRSATKR